MSYKSIIILFILPSSDVLSYPKINANSKKNNHKGGNIIINNTIKNKIAKFKWREKEIYKNFTN